MKKYINKIFCLIVAPLFLSLASCDNAPNMGTPVFGPEMEIEITGLTEDATCKVVDASTLPVRVEQFRFLSGHKFHLFLGLEPGFGDSFNDRWKVEQPAQVTLRIERESLEPVNLTLELCSQHVSRWYLPIIKGVKVGDGRYRIASFRENRFKGTYQYPARLSLIFEQVVWPNRQ